MFYGGSWVLGGTEKHNFVGVFVGFTCSDLFRFVRVRRDWSRFRGCFSSGVWVGPGVVRVVSVVVWEEFRVWAGICCAHLMLTWVLQEGSGGWVVNMTLYTGHDALPPKLGAVVAICNGRGLIYRHNAKIPAVDKVPFRFRPHSGHREHEFSDS